jgi:transposase-like protein
MTKPQEKATTPAAGKSAPANAKWSATHIKRVEKLALLGCTDAQIAAAFDIALTTLKNWRRQYPAFAEAMRRGKLEADAEVAVSLRQRALGYSHPDSVITTHLGKVTITRVKKHYPPDTQAAAIWLYNRQPAMWRRVPDESQGAGEVTPVKVTVEVKSARVRPDDADA